MNYFNKLSIVSGIFKGVKRGLELFVGGASERVFLKNYLLVECKTGVLPQLKD